MRQFMDFFSLSGRASRLQYWLTLAIDVVVVGLAFLAFALFEMREYGHLAMPVTLDRQLLVVALVVAPLCLMALGTGVLVLIKRMHDRNKSGWWFVISLVAPLFLFSLIGNFDGIGAGDQVIQTVIALVGLSIWGWVFVELGFLPGVHSDNRFEQDR